MSGTFSQKSALHLADRWRWPEPFGQSESEPIKQQGLGLVGFDYTADAQLAARIFSQRQDYVTALDAAEFIEDGARAIAQPGATLPLLQRLPQDVGQEADQDMGLHPILALVPDRPQRQFALVDAEGGLRLA